MPVFNTGDPQWDQGLGTLSQTLFPDPSRIAQAGYYGAMQRNQALESEAEERRQRALTNLPNVIHLWGTGPRPAQYTTPGARFPGLMGDGTGVATTAPPPSVPPGMVGSGPVQDGSVQFAPGWMTQGHLPPYQSGTVKQVAQTLMQGDGSLMQALTTGQPPGAASPAPGVAPDVPMTTGSDGSVPANDVGSGRIHFASVTEANGGPKQTGPAQADGSPAPPIDLGPLLTTAITAGLKGPELASVLSNAILEGYQGGWLDQNTASQWLATLGQGNLLQAQTQIAAQNIVTGEQRSEFEQGRVPILRSDGTLGAIMQKTWAANPDAYNVISPAAETALAQQQYQFENYFPKNPDGSDDLTRTVPMLVSQASRLGLTKAPAGYSPIDKTTTGAETAAANREFLVDKAVREFYSAPTGRGFFDMYSLDQPAVLDANAKTEVMNRTIKKFNETPGLRGDQANYLQAGRQVIEEMVQNGELPTHEEINTFRNRGTFVNRAPLTTEDPALVNVEGFDKEGKRTVTKGVPIKLKSKPSLTGTVTDAMQNAQQVPLQQPRVQSGAQGNWNVAPPPPNAQLAPPTQVGPATPAPPRAPVQAPALTPAPVQAPPPAQAQIRIPAPGQAENSLQFDPKTRQPLIVHNGFAVSMTPQEMAEYQAIANMQRQQQPVRRQ